MHGTPYAELKKTEKHEKYNVTTEVIWCVQIYCSVKTMQKNLIVLTTLSQRWKKDVTEIIILKNDLQFECFIIIKFLAVNKESNSSLFEVSY